MSKITIYAVDIKSGEKVEIDDLYWFGENFIRSLDVDEYGRYRFEVVIQTENMLFSVSTGLPDAKVEFAKDAIKECLDESNEK